MCHRPSFVARETQAQGTFRKGNEPGGTLHRFPVFVRSCACGAGYVARVDHGNTWVEAIPDET